MAAGRGIRQREAVHMSRHHNPLNLSEWYVSRLPPRTPLNARIAITAQSIHSIMISGRVSCHLALM